MTRVTACRSPDYDGAMGSANLLYCDDRLQLIGFEDLFIERWSGVGTHETLQRLNDVHGPFVRGHAPKKTRYMVHVTSLEFQVPDAQSRALIEAHVKIIDPHIIASAMVISAGGFAAAMFRAILSASSLVRRERYPFDVFHGTSEALRWLAARRPEPVPNEAQALIAMYAELERTIGS